MSRALRCDPEYSQNHKYECVNCLARHGYNIKRNFGHGRDGLVNLVATLNLFAFALHAVMDCGSDLSRQCRQQAGLLRETALPHAMVLLPLPDRPVRDHAPETRAAGPAPASRDRTPVTPAAENPATDRRWQPVTVTLCSTPLPNASAPVRRHP